MSSGKWRPFCLSLNVLNSDLYSALVNAVLCEIYYIELHYNGIRHNIAYLWMRAMGYFSVSSKCDQYFNFDIAIFYE